MQDRDQDMKFDNSGNTHPILKWARKIALILLIPALVIFFLSLCLSIWETQREKPSYSYQHSQDSNEHIIQYLNCPTITFKDNDVFIGAEIRNLSIKKETNISLGFKW